MRKPFVVGNWKMHTTSREAVDLARDIAAGENTDRVDVVICPPFVYLETVAKVIHGTRVALGAQNMYFEPKGAFTGEISAAMLRDVGCRHVILGHSERRHVIGESDDLVSRKMRAAVTAGFSPILCVGETLEERDAGKTLAVVERHVRTGLAGLNAEHIKAVTIAYEPVWAIGTGRNATSEEAQEVHAEIRKLLAEMYGSNVSQIVRILYGGSVKPENARAILAQPDVDGSLVGGASLKANSFLAIAQASL